MLTIRSSVTRIAAVLAVSLATMGCVSKEAVAVQIEHSVRSQIALERNADARTQIEKRMAERLLAYELAEHRADRVDANNNFLGAIGKLEAAGQLTSSTAAENTTQLIRLLDMVSKNELNSVLAHANNVAVIEALDADHRDGAGAIRAQGEMAEMNARLIRETQKAVANAALSSALAIYSAWEAKNAKPTPEDPEGEGDSSESTGGKGGYTITYDSSGSEIITYH
jgi:hypothetical protein